MAIINYSQAFPPGMALPGGKTPRREESLTLSLLEDSPFISPGLMRLGLKQVLSAIRAALLGQGLSGLTFACVYDSAD